MNYYEPSGGPVTDDFVDSYGHASSQGGEGFVSPLIARLPAAAAASLGRQPQNTPREYSKPHRLAYEWV